MDAKRQVGWVGHPPHLVVVVPLSDQVDLSEVHTLLCKSCDLDDPIPPPPTTLIDTTLKQRFTLVYPDPSNLYSLLDVSKAMTVSLLPPIFIQLASSKALSAGHVMVSFCSRWLTPSCWSTEQGQMSPLAVVEMVCPPPPPPPPS